MPLRITFKIQFKLRWISATVCSSKVLKTKCLLLFGIILKRPTVQFYTHRFRRWRFLRTFEFIVKVCCATSSSGGTSVFESCCHCPEGLIQLMLRNPLENEARFLYFTIQHPGDLISLSSCSCRFSFGYRFSSHFVLAGANTANQPKIIRALDAFTFGVCRG